jgi:hypothetical protein
VVTTSTLTTTSNPAHEVGKVLALDFYNIYRKYLLSFGGRIEST